MASRKLSEMADAYVLSAVLAYSAIFATYSETRLILSLLGTAVLLVNSHYLHAPIHVPSTLLALLMLGIPLTGTKLQIAVVRFFVAVANAPFFVLELSVGVILFGNFVRFAVYRPLRQAAENRRQVVPIPAPKTAIVAHPVQDEKDGAGRSPSNGATLPRVISKEEAREAAREVLTDGAPARSSVEGAGITSPDAPPAVSSTAGDTTADASEDRRKEQMYEGKRVVRNSVSSGATARTRTEQTRAEQTRAEQTRAEQTHAEQTHAETSASTAAATSRVRTRPRKRATQSQAVAMKIMKQKEAEERRRQDAIARQQAEVTARAQAERAAREERERARQQLQTIVREASEGVAQAKRTLAERVVEADRARQARRRAGDQHSISQSVESEQELDRACAEAAMREKEESEALADVNAAQGRLSDVRDRLNRFRG